MLQILYDVILLHVHDIMIIIWNFFIHCVWKINSIFWHLLEFFFVTEFQSRGSQHDNGLLWVANAPIYGLDSNNAIENIVEKYISCDNNKLAPNLCEGQTHHHKKTYKKKKSNHLSI
jgi:hypothetical protein